jgi:hypothetical protein
MNAVPGELAERDTGVVTWLDSPEGLAWTAKRFAPVKWQEGIASLRPLSQLGDHRHQYTPCPDSGDGMVRYQDGVVGMFAVPEGLAPANCPA